MNNDKLTEALAQRIDAIEKAKKGKDNDAFTEGKLSGLYEALAAWNRRTPAETVSREAIALHRIYRMVSEVVANPSDNDMETFVKIMTDIEALQLPAPQPVSTGEIDPIGIPLNEASWAFIRSWNMERFGPMNAELWNNCKQDVVKPIVEAYLKASRPPVPSVVGVPSLTIKEIEESFLGSKKPEEWDRERVWWSDIYAGLRAIHAHLLTRQPDMGAVVELLKDLTPDEPCRYDHNGNCQEHSWFGLNGDKCPVEKAKELLNGR